MLLGFKDRFIPLIEDGSKQQTIRAGYRIKQGDRLDLYARPRQKDMRLVGRVICTRTEVVEIRQDVVARIPIIQIGDTVLSFEETDVLAWQDGFRFERRRPGTGLYSGCARLMYEFWIGNHGFKPFTGQIIYWKWSERFTDVSETCFWKSKGLAERGGVELRSLANVNRRSIEP